MIKVRRLTYTYPYTEFPVLKDIDLDINDGEFVLVEGRSGAGKSTLLYCLNGIIPHLYGGKLTGEINVNGLDPTVLTVSRVASTAGIVFQNPDLQIFMPTVREDIVFGCKNAGLPESTVSVRVHEALIRMGLVPFADKPADELSNGQKQRLAIAGVYALAPDIFLFDESTTDLDEKGKKEFLIILERLKSEGATVIISEHEPGYLEHLIDKKISLKDGVIFPGEVEILPAEMPRHPPVFSSGTAVRIKNVSFGYRRRQEIFTGLNLDFRKGEFTAVVGDNGSGKTTLFKLILGILRAGKGEIELEGAVRYTLDDICGKAGFLFQNPDEQLFAATVEDEIAFGPRQLGVQCDTEVYLEAYGMIQYRGVHPSQLSCGERQRVAFISILAMCPEIIILDEPTTGLDRANWVRLMDTAAALNSQGKTVIFSSHNMNVVEMYARRVIRLEAGRVVSDEIRA
ncbi:MAG: ABC transporter ATP-binding protein [Candidatus Omnitrophica bacterium]|nr:ABC transporter ATP-binding protein [Candidatus Omnitrophota bacterium]